MEKARNRRFRELIKLQPVAADVELLPLNVVNIQELETLVESYEGSQLDFLYVLHNRAIRNPDMIADLGYFLAGVDAYRFPQSERATKIHDQFEAGMLSYLFPGAGSSSDAAQSGQNQSQTA